MIRIVHFNTRLHRTNQNTPLPFFFWLCRSLSVLFLGGGEDYRQNPAESHQFTKGESVFLWPRGTIHVLVTAGMTFPLAVPLISLLLKLRMCCFASCRWSQEKPQGLFNPVPLLTFCWYVAAKNSPACLFVTYPSQAVITNTNDEFGTVSWLLDPNPALSAD